jgi:hypothetical protein
MADSKKKRNEADAEKARRDYRKLKTQRLAGIKADLAPPEVDGIVDPADGTLNKDVLAADLGVTIQIWDDLPLASGDFDTVFLEWAPGDNPADGDYEVVAQKDIVAPVAPALFPLTELKVPMAELAPDGLYSLRYRVESYNGETRPSLNVHLIVDSVPPWKHAEPREMALPATQITDAFLAANSGGLVGTLPDYDDWQLGDKVAFYWLTAPLPSDPDDLPPPVGYIDVVGNAQTVTYPLAVLEASKDQDYYVGYLLVDKATNRSPISRYTRVDVALGPLPDGLKDPEVPLAKLDGLVDLQDARMGVTVEIPRFDNWKKTDRIEVTWGATVLDSEEVGASPIFPFSISVPRLTLRDEYGNASGELRTNVSYRVLRGQVPSAVTAIEVDVDFSVIGPGPVPDPDPDWPDPVNELLLPAEVRGKSSIQLNTLTRADANQPADLMFTLYTPVNEGEVIDFYWGTQQVVEAQYTVQPGDAAGDEINREIPWSYILSEGNNPALPVHYRIHAAGAGNDQYSPDTLVDVDAITVTPDAPIFLGLNARDWLTCVSLYADSANPDPLEPAIRVEIPDLSQYLQDGDEVTLSWTPLSGRDGEDVLVAAIKTETITLGGATPVTGFTWLVQPYDVHILPTYDPGNTLPDGRGRIKYAFLQGTEVVTSLTGETVVSMHDPAGTCEIPPRP